MTHAEIEAQLEGWRWRRDRELELLAYFTAWSMAPHMAKAPVPDDLLPPDVLFRRLNEDL